MTKVSFFVGVLALSFLWGCAQVSETAKTLWGSSTRALEEERANALSRTYKCTFQECFDAVLALGYTDDTWYQKQVEYENRDDDEDEEDDVEGETGKAAEGEPSKEPEVLASGHFEIFIKNSQKKHVVVIGIPGNVDTTEAGIFFEELPGSNVKLEVSSLSSSAKRTVSEIIFEELDKKFSAVE